MSATEDTISVLLPVHAGVMTPHFEAALESVLAQSRPADEIVVVEDGPLSAEHEDLLGRLQGRHPNVRRISLATNQGAGVANQAGLVAANGTWIAKADADDVNVPNRFGRQLELVVARGLDVCGAAMGEFDQEPNRLERVRSNPTQHDRIARRMRVNNPINHPTAFYRRQLALDVGGYPDMRHMQDYDLFARMLQGGARMGNTGEVLVLFRADKAMLGRRRNRRVQSLEREMQANLHEYGVVGRAGAVRNWLLRRLFRALPTTLMRRVYVVLFRMRRPDPRSASRRT